MACVMYDTAVASMGHQGHTVDKKLASLFQVIGELPSMPRPMYEIVQTGLAASEHAVVSNPVVRRSTQPSVFLPASEAGKTTAATAYYWFPRLYDLAPDDRINDREAVDGPLPIQLS